MIDWTASLSPEELSAYAVSLAAVVALISVMYQTKAQRQQARLALLQHRIPIFQSTVVAIQAVIQATAQIKIIFGIKEVLGFLDNPYKGLSTALRTLEGQLDSAAHLFGDDAVAVINEARSSLVNCMVITTRIRMNAGNVQKGRIDLIETELAFQSDKEQAIALQQEAIQLKKKASDVFGRYLNKERTTGLSKRYRIAMWLAKPRGEIKDPLLKPSKPLNEHRTLE